MCFDRPAWYRRTPFTLLLFPLLGLVCYALFEESAMALWGLILIYCGNLFVCCLVCHGEACRLKPAPSFYLLIAAGGALGGVMVGAMAPRVFCSFAELNWGMWLLAALVARWSACLTTEPMEFQLHHLLKPVIRGFNRRRVVWMPCQPAASGGLGGPQISPHGPICPPWP